MNAYYYELTPNSIVDETIALHPCCITFTLQDDELSMHYTRDEDDNTCAFIVRKQDLALIEQAIMTGRSVRLEDMCTGGHDWIEIEVLPLIETIRITIGREAWVIRQAKLLMSLMDVKIRKRAGVEPLALSDISGWINEAA